MPKQWSPGINHIEYWVSNIAASIDFYEKLFAIIGWNKISPTAFSSGTVEIYFKENDVESQKSAGPRHICFQAVSRDVVDSVGRFLNESGATILRGPLEQTYSKDYYTVDFLDPDGFVLEVAHTPNMVL